MKSSKKVKGSAREDDGSETPPPAPVYVNVPPGALLAMFALTAGLAFTAGWLANRPVHEPHALSAAPHAAASIAAQRPDTLAASATPATTEVRIEITDKQAGRLELSPLNITPAPESIEELGWVAQERVWHLRGLDRDRAEAFFKECGLTDSERAALWKTARPETLSRPDAFLLSPPDDLVRNLSRDARLKLYIRLSEEDDNLDQVNAFHSPACDLETWLKPVQIPEPALKLVKSLCYQYKQYWLFADLPLVVPGLNAAERRSLLEALSTQRSWLVRVRMDSHTDPEALAHYYGRGGRASELLPELRALKQIPGGKWVSLRSLMPTFAQTHLNLFPKPTEDPIARSHDCHWTALNFFRGQPDDTFAADHSLVLPEIHRNYHRVNTDFLFGDIVMFLTHEKGSEQARYFHSAVYVAPDLLFTKNGRRPTSPWMFMRFDDALNWYPRTDEVVTLTYRRNDLSD